MVAEWPTPGMERVPKSGARLRFVVTEDTPEEKAMRRRKNPGARIGTGQIATAAPQKMKSDNEKNPTLCSERITVVPNYSPSHPS